MKVINTKLRGVHIIHKDDYNLILAGLQAGTRLKLVHEADNPADSNAVAVYVNNLKLGYLSRDVAKDVNKAVYRTDAEITGITGQNQGVNVVLKIKSFDELQSSKQGTGVSL